MNDSAYTRHNRSMDAAIRATNRLVQYVESSILIFDELRRSRAKFPGNRFLLAALVEEVGELAEAIAKGDKDQIRIEAIQVASTAIRIAEEGDSAEYGPYGFIKLAISVGNVARFLMQRKPVTRSLEDASNAIRVLWAGEDDTFADVTDEEAKP